MPDQLGDLECIDQANTALQELLKGSESCELPLGRVADLATDHGVSPVELLSKIEGTGGCVLDWATGHVRCTPVPEEVPTVPIAATEELIVTPAAVPDDDQS